MVAVVAGEEEVVAEGEGSNRLSEIPQRFRNRGLDLFTLWQDTHRNVPALSRRELNTLGSVIVGARSASAEGAS